MHKEEFIIKRSNKPIKQVSEKYNVQLHKYQILRKELLEKYPVCQVCNINSSTQCHHMHGRGKYLLEFLLMVCTHCHQRIHNEFIWATKNGYLISKTKQI